jgi:hypothetical protein
MLISGVVLLHKNAHPQTAAHTRAVLEHFNWELFDHPYYSPDLAPSDYHLFTYLKNWLRSQRFNKNEELVESVKTCVRSQAADFFDTGVQKLIPQYKCLNSGGDYVKKIRTYFRTQYFFLVDCFVNSSPEVTFRIALVYIYIYIYMCVCVCVCICILEHVTKPRLQTRASVTSFVKQNCSKIYKTFRI